MIEIQGLTKRYGRTTALADLDLSVADGEVFGYLGPNGAGKSTTIALLLGLIRPSSGSARVAGIDAWRDPAAAHRHLAYVPSEANLWPELTGGQTLSLLADVHGGCDTDYRAELLERFELDPHRRVRTYSHGNRQKVLLVAAFATRADVLLLDEPTTGLDPLMEQVFRSCVREARDRGQTVLLSSHVLSEVEAVSDRVGMLRAGRLIDVGGLDHFRTLAATHVRVRFGHRIPELPAVSNLSAVTIHDNVLEGRIVGSIQPFITALAQCDVAELTTGPASLEELFVEHYRTGPQTPGP